MADETKNKILKTVGKAVSKVVPGAKVVQTLKDLRNKKKKAKFQEGDYSDIKVKGIIDPIKVEVKPAEMPKFKNKNDNSVEMPKPYIENEKKYKSMEPSKRKKYITVPRDSKNIPEFKLGGRAGYKMGSKCKLATKGKGRAYGKNS